MNYSILWNVYLISLNGHKGELIFVGYRDVNCDPDKLIEALKSAVDELIGDMEKSLTRVKQTGFHPQFLIEMKKICAS